MDDFVAFRRHIQSHGTIEPRPSAPTAAIYHNKYLVIGDHNFWAMGPNRDRDAVEQFLRCPKAEVRCFYERTGLSDAYAPEPGVADWQ